MAILRFVPEMWKLDQLQHIVHPIKIIIYLMLFQTCMTFFILSLKRLFFRLYNES